MLNILLLDQKYITYTLDLKQYLWKFLFNHNAFPIRIGNAQILVEPRSSDLFTIYEIFTDRGYLPKIQGPPLRIETVVDFGANIGVFSIWVSRFFSPKAVYAVEMEPACYDRLVENVALNHLEEVVRPLQAAIYCSSGSTGAKKIRGSNFFELAPGQNHHQVRTVSFEDFLKATGLGMIDLLKIDIEGAEKYLLTEANAPLFRERVRYAVLETHSLNDFHAEHGIAYFQKLGFECARTPTPYRIDRNFIIDAYNPALCREGEAAGFTLSTLGDRGAFRAA